MLLGKHLRKVINQLEEENRKLKSKNQELEHNNIILLDTNRELRNKVVVLENNLEIVTNNLTPKKKKLLGIEYFTLSFNLYNNIFIYLSMLFYPY